MNLKFRAWHKELKRMYPVYTMECIDTKYMRVCSPQGDVFSINHVELMQWTGFVDNNGTDIYDGDIISNDWDAGYVYCTVFWDGDDGFWKVRQAGSGEIDPLYEMNEKVIGNIYENPELLEQNND